MPPLEHRDWPAIRRAYEGRRSTVDTVCKDFDVPSRTLYNRAAAEGWELRQPAVSLGVRRQKGFATARAVVIGRLYKVLERQLAAIETRTDAAGSEGSREHDIETSATILRLLERLTALSRPDGAAAARTKPDAKATKGSNVAQELSHDDAEHFRRDLAIRIDRLKRSGGP